MIDELCKQYGIQNRVQPKKLEMLRKDYEGKLVFGKELKKCIEWLYDNDKHILTTSRLRNWLRKSLEFQKRDELKALAKYQDKCMPQYKKYEKEPLWQPPK